MSAQPEHPGTTPDPGLCPGCSALLEATDTRCPECNYDLAGVAGRPGAYSRATLWWTVAGFAVVYLVVLLVVIATN